MKIKDLKDYESEDHCFGEVLKINGKDYEDYSKEEIVEFIQDMFENDVNSEHLIRETFKNALEYLDAEIVDNNRHTCDQCDHDNSYTKYIIIQ